MNSTYDPLVGQVLDDRYEVLAKLARGGMATVYRAFDRRLHRTVAVKVMRNDIGDEDELVAKFDREARAAAALNHPSVVGVFDQGQAEGKPYIVMEFVEGETLRRLISRDAPLPPPDACDLLEPIVAALAAAHEVGLVHRDIKPENVLLSTRGQVKVADFGLARLVSSPQVTATGVLVGTASYLPPELVTHSRPDSRSDVYSAGVVAFEMLTGAKPHTGENNYQIAYRHVNVDIEPPSARFTADGHRGWHIPDYVDAFVQACTTRDPETRLADGRVMLARLREVRRALAQDPQADDPALAASLRPSWSGDPDVTRELGPRVIPRPREYTPTSASTPDSSPALNDDLWLPQGINEAPTQVTPNWQPVTQESPPPVQLPPRPTPVAPRVEEPTSAVRPSRTPSFPRPQLVKERKYRRRRGIAAIILILLVAAALGIFAWWFTSGRFTAVPTVSGIPEVDALAALEANSLTGDRTTEYSEDVIKGVVIASSPLAGDRVLRGSTVELHVSLGPERFAMPTVVGKQQLEAEELITAQSLKVGKVTEEWSESKTLGVVLRASEEPDAQLKRDTAVDLFVSKGPEPIEIKDFSGQETAVAKKELEAAGFKVKVVEENSKTVAAGSVISQDPSSGTGQRGNEINLTSSKGPVMVNVPDVRYKGKDEATKMLEDLGFEVEIQYATGFPLALEIASGTEPGSGTSLAEGSKVVLLIA